MKNIHILPTDKPSRLRITSKGKLILSTIAVGSKGETQNIYITSDEEIKEGDYFWKPDCNMIFCAEYTPHKGCQKVILTTDQDLIKDGVQAIDDEFLEWFVRNPSCEDIEISHHVGYTQTLYFIVIPKEEPKQDEIMERFIANAKQQETLEQVAEKYAKQFDYAEDSSPQLDFINGAKWQQEQIGKSEFLQKLRATLSDAEARRLIFEQFKKE